MSDGIGELAKNLSNEMYFEIQSTTKLAMEKFTTVASVQCRCVAGKKDRIEHAQIETAIEHIYEKKITKQWGTFLLSEADAVAFCERLLGDKYEITPKLSGRAP